MSAKFKVSPEVKAEILKKVKEGGVSIAQAAADYGIGESTIYTWLGKGIKTGPTWPEFARLKRQNQELYALWASSPSSSAKPKKRIDCTQKKQIRIS